MKFIILFAAVVIITTPCCYAVRAVDSAIFQMCGTLLPRGVAGGSIYTRWGRTVCPDTDGTQLVYEGIVAGSHYNKVGGGANYLCITADPEYLTDIVPRYNANSPPALAFLYGTEYQTPATLKSVYDQNPPCAVCRTSARSTQLMIPGKTTCPDSSWTEEYKGYLVTEREHPHHHSVKVFECMDRDPEIISGEARSTDGALFQLVGAVCNIGLPCPKFIANRPITCVVCTK